MGVRVELISAEGDKSSEVFLTHDEAVRTYHLPVWAHVSETPKDAAICFVRTMNERGFEAWIT